MPYQTVSIKIVKEIKKKEKLLTEMNNVSSLLMEHVINFNFRVVGDFYMLSTCSWAFRDSSLYMFVLC